MSNELREAAERLSTLSGIGRYMRDQAAVDAVKVAEAWLSEHQPDDGETADEEWLNELAKTSETFVYSIVDGVANFATSNARNGYCSLRERDKRITRGQVRLLLRALQ